MSNLGGLPHIPTAAHFSAAGTSLILAWPDGGIPSVRYWGPALGELSDAELRSAVETTEIQFLPGQQGHPTNARIVALQAQGWTGRPGICGSFIDGTGWSPRFLLRSTPKVLPPAGSAEHSALFTLESTDRLLDLTVEVEMTADGLTRIRATLTNNGRQPYRLDELAITLPVPNECTEILDFAGRWSKEKQPRRFQVSTGCHLHEGRKGRAGFDAPPMLFTGTSGFDFENGDIWGVHTAISSSYRVWAERDANGVAVLGGSELLQPGEITLQPGESYSSPWIFFAYGVGLDSLARHIHSWVRSLPSAPHSDRPITLNVWEAVYFDHDPETLVNLARVAAGIGVERFVLDDGWFLGRRSDAAGLGDWKVDPTIWPHGLWPLVNEVTALGMQFGLWVEPEMVNMDSQLARAHPEWIMRARDELPISMRNQQVLNLADPAAYAYIRNALVDLLSEYPISYLKWDNNRDIVDGGNRGGAAVTHRHIMACYRLMDELRDQFPGLEIESCASGGGRIDLGMIEHVQRFWASDCIDPHERLSIQTWTAQLVPPEMIGTHVSAPRARTTGRVTDLDFRASMALLGHMGIEWNLLEAKPEEIEELAAWITEYKHLRPLVAHGTLVRGTYPQAGLMLTGLVSPDRSHALYGVTVVERAPIFPNEQIKLPGLDPAAEYTVRIVPISAACSGYIPPLWAQQDNPLSLRGRLLETIGIQTPQADVDHTILIETTKEGKQ